MLISLTAGDTAPTIAATITNASGPQALNGASVVARLTDTNTGVVTELDCTITDDAGQVSIPVPVNGWPQGLFVVEFHVTYADGTAQTFPSIASEREYLIARAA